MDYIRLPSTLIILLLVFSSDTTWPSCLAVTSAQELLKGFSATPVSSVSSFQPILSDQFGNFSLGFLRLNRNQLALAVIHVASSEPLWSANPIHLASWSQSTRLFFNGSLVISDPETDLLWSTATHDGDRVVLLNTSNLQVQKNGDSGSVIWQSFDFPTNTIVQDQNFTASMALVSLNGLYSMRMGADFMGLYATYTGGSDELYWKRTPLEAKAEIVEGDGPIYARISSDGYLGMYQTSTKPLDVQKFKNFQRPNPLFLMVRTEPDGNLKGYCWDGSTWVLNYQAIDDICELPNPCGSYGLCTPGASECSCLDNRTSYSSPGGCMKEGYGDLCGSGIAEDSYWVLRRRGVEPAHKELMRYEMANSLEKCEGMCEDDCRCWGALYYNATGYCYVVEHPIQTMVGTGVESKVGYFKVRKDARGQRKRVGMVVGIVLGVVVVAAVIGAVSYERRRRRGGGKGMGEEEDRVTSGPYKNLESASFRSIEMSNSH
ncbi:hypothetical protein QN277_013085 [Acacia crassicarpa]|uniref:Apple domain-containing protein n=1 Tax=Acacia crassicarpa TaxID=499986 RepID=A0AAE1TFE4_9FABA|nr:hypothetical protein QN277_013085 [Acacia crassicarpa]